MDKDDGKRIGSVIAHKLKYTPISRVSSCEPFGREGIHIKIESEYGPIKFCPKIEIVASDAEGNLLAQDAKTLSQLLDLPEAHHPLDHYYKEDTPKVTIEDFEFCYDSTTGNDSVPHLNGRGIIHILWQQAKTTIKIKISSSFTKLMFDSKKHLE